MRATIEEMADWSGDWMAQAERDLEVAAGLYEQGAHESAYFAGDDVPVDVDLFVYTEDEFARILARGDLFSRDMQNVVWL